MEIEVRVLKRCFGVFGEEAYGCGDLKNSASGKWEQWRNEVKLSKERRKEAERKGKFIIPSLHFTFNNELVS